MSTKLFASFAVVSVLFGAVGCATATDPLAGDDGGVVDGGGGGDTSSGGDTTPPADSKADAPPSDAPCAAPSKVCGGTCTDVTKDSSNCGACGKACPAGVACVDGGCKAACGPDTVSCDGTCANLLTDKDHCGTCTTKCPTDTVCVDAKCKLSCTAPLMDCGVGKCVDLQTDNANCGACIKSCRADQSCTAGVCGCGVGKTDCSGRCVDLLTDNSNCGTCGTFCSGFTMACTAGKCVCSGGKTSCGGTCVDTTSDDANCGACGTVCDASASMKCHGSVCTLDCGTSGTVCGGVCKFLGSDPANCGACGAVCAAGQFCSSGVCTCTAGLANCGGSCVDLKSDGSNCGFCARACTAGTVCSGGGCGTSCGGGRTACGTSCLDLSSDPKNCGTCGTVCSTGLCGGGVCLTAPPCKPTGPYQVLFYGPTKTGSFGGTASEQTFLPSGSVSTTADATMWSAMGASDFAKYDLIVVGEGGVCPTKTLYDTLFATRATWATAVLGRILVTEQDPVFHSTSKTGADTFLRAALQWAAGGPGTGLYVGAECGARALDFLSPFGGIASVSGSGDTVHILAPSHPSMIGSTDASLSTWGSSYHGTITSWPADWVEITTGSGSPVGGVTVGRDKVCAP